MTLPRRQPVQLARIGFSARRSAAARTRLASAPLGVVAALALLSAGLGISTAAAQENAPYVDVPADAYYAVPVRTLAQDGVFAGTLCEDGFCPSEPVDRKTMAVWTVRVLDGDDPPAVSETRFDDVDADGFHAPFIERMAELGVTTGCGDGTRFCPDDTVTRAQMAVFLSRAYNLAEGPDPGFRDVASDAWFAAGVAALAASGITKGCGDGTTFCPNNPTTRAQMATFLHRAISRTAEYTGTLSVVLESSAPLVVEGGFDVTLRFSAPVSGLTASDITVVNGRVEALTGSDANYIASIATATDGTVMVRLPAGAVRGGDDIRNESSAAFIRTRASTARVAPPGIDTWNRAAVIESYKSEFDREEPDWEYTGDVENCLAGTTNQTFRDSVIQRVNWYRRMAGLNTVAENVELSTRAREAALMMRANGTLSHFPTPDWNCYTSLGASGAGGSNLGFGSVGVSGIGSYMADYGEDNRPVGHRRWILYPSKLEMGTGNVPHAHALYVLGRNHLKSDVREQRGFVAWPPSGYVPWGVVWARWSFSLGGGDLSDANVSVSDSAGPVQAETVHRSASAIVWGVPLGINSLTVPAPTDGDHCYTVMVSGVRIGDEIQSRYEYPVCVIDPVDLSGPTVTVTSMTPQGQNERFSVSITFSEPVTGFVQDEVFVANGRITAFTGSGRQYKATIVPDQGGDILVTVAAGAVHDIHRRPNSRASLLLRETVMGRPSVVLSSSAPPAVNDAFEVAITFGEPVVNAGATFDLLSIRNGTVTFVYCGPPDGFTECTATILPDDYGDVIVTVDAGAVHDMHGHTNTASAALIRQSKVVTVGIPTVALSSSSPSVVYDEFEVAITFSQLMAGYTPDRIDVLNGAVASLICEPWGAFRECTATILPFDYGEITVTVDAGTAYSRRGIFSAASAPLLRESGIADTANPTVTLSSSATPVVHDEFDVLITFSKPVKDYEFDRILVMNGTVKSLHNCGPSPAFRECTATIVPDDYGNVTVTTAAGFVYDRHGQPSAASAPLVRESGLGKPSVVIWSSAPPVVHESFEVMITFSTPVTGFEQDHVIVINGTVASFSGSGREYRATILPAADYRVVIVFVPNGAARDEDSRPNSASGFFCRPTMDSRPCRPAMR